MLTLAEGVETRDQLNLLRRLGCDSVQGFLFGKPLPTEMIRSNILQKELEFETDEERDFYSGNDAATVRITPGKCIVNGMVRDIKATKKPFYYGGKVSGLMGYFIDVTDENLERDRLSKLSNTDELTGVFNRRGYSELIDDYERQYREDGKDFALFMMDINNFKEINDSFGHEFGDKVLLAACRNLRRVAAKNSVVIRYGGDEFIILHQYSNSYDLIILMQRITAALSSIAEVEDKQIQISIAIGYDVYSVHKDKIKLIEAADAKMYENKSRTKGK